MGSLAAHPKEDRSSSTTTTTAPSTSTSTTTSTTPPPKPSFTTNPTTRYGHTTYTPSQLTLFLQRIHLPPHHLSNPILQDPSLARSPVPAHARAALDFVAVLQRYTLAAVPFESLSLHYSPHHAISIEPQALFAKIVTGGDGAGRGAGRGGYCMENSGLFGTVLRSLGFEVYSAGARVNEAVQPMAGGRNWKGPKFDGWNHMINLVTIGGQKYIVDVGFGSSGPHHPIPLKENYTSPNVGTQSLRLVRTTPPDLLTHDSPAQALWTYEYRHTDSSPYLPAYCFGETEFTPSDFTMMNWFMSTSRTSWFTHVVLCVKMIMSDDEKEELIGDITLVGGEIKKRIGGESETLAVVESEDERVAALEKYFGVRLSADERGAIKGWVSELA